MVVLLSWIHVIILCLWSIYIDYWEVLSQPFINSLLLLRNKFTNLMRRVLFLFFFHLWVPILKRWFLNFINILRVLSKWKHVFSFIFSFELLLMMWFNALIIDKFALLIIHIERRNCALNIYIIKLYSLISTTYNVTCCSVCNIVLFWFYISRS